MNIWVFKFGERRKIILSHKILIFVVMSTISFTANAEQVYENVDEEGVIEFSDKPGLDAQVIDVEEPNVADTLPAELDTPPTSAPTTSIDPTTEQPVEIQIGGSNYEDPIEKREERREEREERKERMENGKEVVRQPVRKGVKSK